jgi:site-specific recombinase XerD
MEKTIDLVSLWKDHLQSEDHSQGTIKKYTQAVVSFLKWSEAEQGRLLTLNDLNPITLIGYRNALQLEQRKSVSTINLRISALRAWCQWLLEKGHLASDPSARLKLVNGKAASKRDGLSHPQVNALLRQAQSSLRDKNRNFAIIQVLLQTGIRLGECAALVYGDITFGERSGMLTVRAGKGNKVRSVPLNASARDALALCAGELWGIEHPSIKAVATRWPKAPSSESLQPIWLSQKGGDDRT